MVRICVSLSLSGLSFGGKRGTADPNWLPVASYQVHPILNFRDPPPHVGDLQHHVRLRQIVGLEGDDNIPGALSGSEDGSAQLIRLRPEIGGHLPSEAIDDAFRVLGRGVVDDDDLLVQPFNSQGARDRGTNKVAVRYTSL